MLEFVYFPVDALKPYEKNARKHSEKDIDAIVNSIKQFGFNDPIGVWGKDNLIVEGHGRLLAAQKLGMTEVPCIRLDELSDEQRRAYALAHNKTAEMSEWDFDLLGGELDDIFDIDMGQFGFEFDDEEELDESDLDSAEEKNSVIVSLNCGSVEHYEMVKDRLQDLCDEIGGSLSVKMA